jgi:Phosphoserine phosphatase RsbU, N-terminal domain
MTGPVPRLRQNYAAAFARYLFHRDEAALSAAYELGRSSLESGVGLLDVVQIHHEVVMEVRPGLDGPQELADAATTFLVEVLAPFEMTRRAFRDLHGPAD